MHGTTMMFLFAVPVMLAMGIYLVPLMVGARAIAFPRLVAYGYWMFLFGGIFLYVMFLLNIGPGQRLVQLSAAGRSGVRLRQARRRLGAAHHLHRGLVAGRRDLPRSARSSSCARPGMSLNRMPLFVWAMLVVSFMVIFAMPAVDVLEHLPDPRSAGQHPLLQPGGGRRPDSLAAPVLVLRPSRGLHHLPAGARDDVGDHRDLLAAAASSATWRWCCRMVATAFIGFGVWVHHMFATGLPQLGQSFFTAASIMIVVPTAHADLQLDRDDLDRPAAAAHGRRSSTRRRSSSSSSSAA